jgi:MinD superfamily P-loop ATPase
LDFVVQIHEHLSTAATGRKHASTSVPHGNDRLKILGSRCSSCTQRNELCTRPACEVEDVESGEDLAGAVSNGGGDGVQVVIGVQFHGSRRSCDQLVILLGQGMSCLRHRTEP